MALVELLNVLHPERWFAFLILIPFVVVYLIRPKPKVMSFPALQFLIHERGVLVQNAFLQSLLRNILFLVQLLILLLLSLAILEPVSKIMFNVADENTVIVLDVSASMRTSDRFENALSIAKKSVRGKVSVILAGSIPVVALEFDTPENAHALFSKLQPKEVTSNIGDAMNLAGEMLASKEGKIVVISDFAATEGPDPQVSAALLTKKGFFVDMISVWKKAENVGIINAKIDVHKTTLLLKNFNNQTKTVTLKVANALQEKTLTITLLAQSIESVVFDTFAEETKAVIQDKDDFMTDNTVFLLGPASAKLQVLLISNKPSPFLKAAMQSIGNVQVTVAEPPVVPSITQNIIILDAVQYPSLLPGTIADIKKRVENGAGLVIVGQSGLGSVDFLDLLPVIIKGDGESTIVKQIGVNQFTKDVQFGTVAKHLLAAPLNDTIVLATTNEQTPILAVRQVGKGSVFYYGILPDTSDFQSSPSYPILWRNMFDYLAGTESVSAANVKTGLVLPVQGIVQTPLGSVKTTVLSLDIQGKYSVGDRKIVANLLSEKESDVVLEPAVATTSAASYAVKTYEKTKEVDLAVILGILALILFIFELYLTKSRGDL